MSSISELRLADIMNRDVRYVVPDCPLAEAAHAMAGARISSFLVLDAGRLLGIVTERDLVRFLHEGTVPSTPVFALMSAPVLTAPQGYHYGRPMAAEAELLRRSADTRTR